MTKSWNCYLEYEAIRNQEMGDCACVVCDDLCSALGLLATGNDATSNSF